MTDSTTSEYRTLDEYRRSLPWRYRLRIWFVGRKVRRLIRQGWIPTAYDLCPQCLHPIQLNDDAMLCTHCGGRNLRIVK